MLITASVVTPYSADASERYPEQGSSCEPAGGAQESPANALARPKLVSAVHTAARQKKSGAKSFALLQPRCPAPVRVGRRGKPHAGKDERQHHGGEEQDEEDAAHRRPHFSSR